MSVSTLQLNPAPQTQIASFLQRWSYWLYLSAIVGLCALEASLGALPSRVYAHDLFIFLDGAWRVACGQTPNVDFYAGYGVLVWNPVRWGLALHGYNADGIGLARAFYTAFIGVWYFLLSRISPRRVQSMLLGFFILMFVSAARPLGEYPTWISHAAFYNRVGYALLFLIIFEQLGVSRFQAADEPGPRLQDNAQFWRGVSTGAALACIVLVRASFLPPGLALLATGLFLFGIHRTYLIGALAGTVGTVAIAITCLHFHPAAFLSETILLVNQRAGLTGDAVNNLVREIGAVGFILAAGWVVAKAGFMNRLIADKYMVATVMIAGCDIFCRAMNSMDADLPLAAFWSLSGAMLLVPFTTVAVSERVRRQRTIALVVLCPLAMPILLMDFSSSMYAVYKTLATRNHVTLRFDSARLRDWVPQDWLGADPNFVSRNGRALILATNDGIHLLQSLSRQDETVFCLAYDNPFSFALGRRPAEGGAVWLFVGENFSTHRPPPESTLIGHPDLLMVERPNAVEQDSTKAILSLYPDLLTKEFAQVGSSQYWTLYRRKS
jgi:hypothetical protein